MYVSEAFCFTSFDKSRSSLQLSSFIVIKQSMVKLDRFLFKALDIHLDWSVWIIAKHAFMAATMASVCCCLKPATLHQNKKLPIFIGSKISFLGFCVMSCDNMANKNKVTQFKFIYTGILNITNIFNYID
ncbi:hypothetical protein RclHR1_04170001 [Rhizophagus clarus]|uniref:Uncharacterized protein n=1 Tax=Rhizophagus clarus TaxID=94130 RepID=A0A2Z6RFD3_9GLOM|nr:hypothetical protein RclHR1_04170001 [Rhizophagus clarus]